MNKKNKLLFLLKVKKIKRFKILNLKQNKPKIKFLNYKQKYLLSISNNKI